MLEIVNCGKAEAIPKLQEVRSYWKESWKQPTSGQTSVEKERWMCYEQGETIPALLVSRYLLCKLLVVLLNEQLQRQ